MVWSAYVRIAIPLRLVILHWAMADRPVVVMFASCSVANDRNAHCVFLYSLFLTSTSMLLVLVPVVTSALFKVLLSAA